MRTWIDVAVIAKARNQKGRFVAKAAAGLPLLLEEGDEVAFVPPKLDVPRRAVVASVVDIDEKSAEVQFEDEAGAQCAHDIVGMHCLIRRCDIDEEALEGAPGLWEEWRVVDAQLGEVGVVVDVIDNPAQPLLQVQGDKSTFLVPVVDDIVTDLDTAGQIVHVELPQGLIDLNA